MAFGPLAPHPPLRSVALFEGWGVGPRVDPGLAPWAVFRHALRAFRRDTPHRPDAMPVRWCRGMTQELPSVWAVCPHAAFVLARPGTRKASPPRPPALRRDAAPSPHRVASPPPDAECRSGKIEAVPRRQPVPRQCPGSSRRRGAGDKKNTRGSLLLQGYAAQEETPPTREEAVSSPLSAGSLKPCSPSSFVPFAHSCHS